MDKYTLIKKDKWFFIEYEMNTGLRCIRNAVLIKAENKSKAKKYLRDYISKSEKDCVTNKIIEIKVFDGYFKNENN